MTDAQTAIDKLKEKLTGTRLKAPGTISTYICTAKKFLEWTEGEKPSESLVNRWFAFRRDNDVGERTLRTEFFRLKKLFQCNGWPWSFTSREDAPLSEEDPHAPAHSLEEVEAMIGARDKYSKAECFYLAVSTTFGCRREELARLRKRDYDDNTILIKVAKHGIKVKHLMPEILKPILMAYHPNLNQRALTYMYHRILTKAGIKEVKGGGFHSIRRTLRSVLEWKLAENRLPLSLVADYQGWAKTTKGMVYGGAPMLGVYAHHEAMSSDPYYIDKLVYGVHPWLKLWASEKKEAETCQMCHWASGCNKCCLKCEEPCNTKQSCGLKDTKEQQESRLKFWKKEIRSDNTSDQHQPGQEVQPVR